MRTSTFFIAASLLSAGCAVAQSRGELLYDTHCISCHTTEVHWRDKTSATDWTSLSAQVRRWQAAASLSWSDGDILEVSRHLNGSFYHFVQMPEPTVSVGQAIGAPAGAAVPTPSVGK
jgi:hypothetical protein